jgi:large subunit ribosomal protein L6
MSRIGTVPISIPKGVDVRVEAGRIVVKGPKGELVRPLTGGIRAAVDAGRLTLQRPDDQVQSKALHGLYRSLAQGMVTGVSEGFSRRLEVVGVSYQAAVEGKRLRLQVGFSHPIHLTIPKGLTVECPSATQIQIAGCDKQLVGEFAARVRRVRPPEPYKGKGIRYQGEQITLKAGKSFVGGEK